MPNVSLQPGNTPLSVDDMIKNVEKGIYIIGDVRSPLISRDTISSLAGQLFYEIKDGKIAGMLNDVAYQANTQEFWNSCTQVCDANDYRLGGAFNDGKGSPAKAARYHTGHVLHGLTELM